jgi:hypothetical protein
MKLTGRNPVRHPGKRVCAVVAVGVLSASSLAACSTLAKLTTKQAVGNSLSTLQDQSGISLAFSVGLTPSQITQLADEHGGSGIPAQVAQTISQSSIVLSFATGNGEELKSKQTEKDRSDRFDFGLKIGSTMPVEIRYVGQALYARVQLTQLLSDFGQGASAAAGIQSALQKGNQYVPGLDALGQGKWVSITKASLAPLLAIFKQLETSALGKSSLSQYKASALKLEGDLKSAFKNNATYTNAGTSGGRTRYNVSVALQALVQQAGTALETYLATIPGVGNKISSADISKAASDVPAQAQLQLYVKNNRAEEIDIDVNQFLPAKDKAPFQIPIRLVIGQPGTISAPSGATQLDLSKIGTLISGMLGGLSSGGFSSFSGSGSSTATG